MFCFIYYYHQTLYMYVIRFFPPSRHSHCSLLVLLICISNDSFCSFLHCAVDPNATFHQLVLMALSASGSGIHGPSSLGENHEKQQAPSSSNAGCVFMLCFDCYAVGYAVFQFKTLIYTVGGAKLEIDFFLSQHLFHLIFYAYLISVFFRFSCNVGKKRQTQLMCL